MDNRAWASGASASPPTAPASPSVGYPTAGDPANGTHATKGGAFWFHQLGEEMRAVLTAAGITPSTANNAQLLEAIQRLIDAQSGNYALDTGAANAYVVALSPAITAYGDGMTVRVKAVNANTGASTLNAGGGTVALHNDVGGALVDGDIPAASIFSATYIAASNEFRINSLVQSQDDTRYGSSQFSVSASVAANALTVGLSPCKMDFRNATLTNGASVSRNISSALSLAVPSGATLGTTNATQARLVLLAIDNAGTVELAIVNLAGGNNLDETTLISTTAISAASAAANVIYSTTARANVPFRVVGFIDITETAAGTWATAPSTIQGAGGNAMSALGGLGFGQTWQALVGSRAASTTYYNTTRKPISVKVGCYNTANSTLFGLSLTVNGVTSYQIGIATAAGGTLAVSLEEIVPPGGSYSVSIQANTTLNVWNELR